MFSTTSKYVALCLVPLNLCFLLLVNSRIGSSFWTTDGAVEALSQIVEKRSISPLQDSSRDPREHPLLSLNTTAIRKWGCNRTETPFVFVHVGKAGGGAVRMRLAAASLNWTLPWDNRTKRVPDLPVHTAMGNFYPLLQEDGTTITKVRMINSMFTDRRPSNERTYEGNLGCHANTPIGIAIGCPEPMQRINRHTKINYGVCHWNSTDCHLVYLGHNNMGSELRWLPVPYLSNWWNQQIMPQSSAEAMIRMPWNRLDPSHLWCKALNISRPNSPFFTYRKYPAALHDQCSIPISRQIDALAHRALAPSSGWVDSWAPLYASLPVLRATVLRDPYDWMISKYFWHWRKGTNETLTCDNIADAVHPPGYHQATRQQFYDQQHKDVLHPGWLTKFAWIYIFYICGDDCLIRFATGRAGLPDLELQAEQNLRHSFAVVGLLEEMDDFYDMVSKRVQYMDTHLNADQKGPSHGTSNRGEAKRCKALWKDPEFREKVRKSSPELRVMQRLYKVAVEVNQFQKQELQECSADGSRASK